MNKTQLKRKIALALASLTLAMSVVPHLPPDLLSAWAAESFKPVFENSGAAGHPDIYGTIPGQNRTGFFCVNEGASAKSGYTYTKVDQEVNYSEGTIEQKRLFWAYVLTFGSAQVGEFSGDDTLERAFGLPLEGNTMVGKKVAWSKGKEASGIIEEYATDGFMKLERSMAY